MPSTLVQARNGQLLIVDPAGNTAQVSDNDPNRASHGIYMPANVPAANTTDLVTITGNANKVIRVRSIIITGTATAASNVQIFIYRRSTPNTGGTFTSPTFVQRDINDDAATALIKLYTANPTGLGTLVGPIDGGRLNIAPAANGQIDRMPLQYGWLNDKVPVLRGPNDSICIGFAGAAQPAGAQYDVAFSISEE